jgi:hypothetical protein
MTARLDEHGELQGPIVSAGHRMGLIAIAIVKRFLLSDMPSELRLRFLGVIENHIDAYITPEMVATIEPLCDQAWQIVEASGAFKGKIRNPPDFSAWRLLESQHVFGLLLKLNPSLLEAIRLGEVREAYVHVPVAKTAAEALPDHQPSLQSVEYLQGEPASFLPRPGREASDPPPSGRDFNLFTGA